MKLKPKLLAGAAATTAASRRRCFVCRKRVTKTPMGKIGGHLDRVGNCCEGSWESYTLAIEA